MNNKDLLKFGKCLLIGIIVAIGGTFFSDLYGNIFNGSGDYRLSAIFGIGLYLCIVIVTCTGLIALDRKLKEKELTLLQARDEELDGLFERIYEDNVSGKLSDDRFAKMSRRYEEEQKEVSEKIKTLRSEMDKLSSKAVTADMFISTVRKYTRAKALTPRMLNELIDRIEVHQAEKIDGEWVQHLTIHYNCVGAIFIPEVFPLPVPEVSVNTRKGVVVNYAPCHIAI